MKLIRCALLTVAVPAFFAATPLAAQTSPVKLESIAKVEVTQTDAQGNQTTTLKDPKETAIPPGTFVQFTLNYSNTGAEAAANFVAVNPMPSAIAFVSVGEDWADVSVDGGKTFGKLASLTVTPAAVEGAAAPEARAATAADVTAVRWAFKTPIPAGASGKLTYRGVVK